MRSKYFKVLLVVLFLVGMVAPKSFADERDEEIAVLKTQVQELLKRIEKLETEQGKAKEEVAKLKETTKVAEAGRVDLANALSKLKLKGRWAAGYYDSGKAGSFPAGSWEVPEGKIQFSFQPDDVNTVVMRLNVNNATFNNLDYFYLESKDFLPFLKDTPFSLSSRLGRFKLGFGEETWSDNPVESILPSNSAAKAGLNDEGVELAGKIKLDRFKIGNYELRPLGWVVSVSDGNSGTGSDSGAGKALMTKLHYTPIDPLYLSASYYDSGSLKRSAAEMSIAGLTSAPSVSPTSASMHWERRVWEIDARYDFKKGKKSLNPPAFSDSKAILRLSYGEFHDDVTSTSGTATERSGNFGFVDGIYNLNKRIYAAGRYSFVDLDGDTTASLNSVTTNRYNRYSLGAGYRWSENTILKVSYDWNRQTGGSTQEADDDLLSAIVATQF